MRKTIALGLAAIFFLAVAAGPHAAGAAPLSGTLSGVARDARGGQLVNAGIRVRSASRGDVVSQIRTSAGGVFSASGLQPGTYIVEALGLAGQVIGVSPTVSVISGRTASVTVMAAQAQAPGTLSQAGFSLFGLGTAASWGIIAAAAAGTVTTIAVVAGGDDTASPSQ